MPDRRREVFAQTLLDTSSPYRDTFSTEPIATDTNTFGSTDNGFGSNNSNFGGSNSSGFGNNNSGFGGNSSGLGEMYSMPTDMGGDTPERSALGRDSFRMSRGGGLFGDGLERRDEQPVYDYRRNTPDPVQTQAMSMSTPVNEEVPRVFSSLKHQDLYIYEFSDRLDYYLKTESRMMFLGTRQKQR